MPYKNIEINAVSFNRTYTAQRKHYYKGFTTIEKENKTSKIYDLELIKQNILNHFNTKKGSRVMNPEFGTIIWDMLMEPLTEDNKNLLLNDLTSILSFDPRAYPLEINLTEYEHGYFIESTLQLINSDQSTVLRLAFDQKLGLVEQ